MSIEVETFAIIKPAEPLGKLSLRSLRLGPITPPENPGGDEVGQNGGMTSEGADETAMPMGGEEDPGPSETEIFPN